MTEKKPRKAQARSIVRVNGVLQAAADMFLEMGYDALSIDAVIARAGGSRRTIYDHFGGKQGLFIEAITRRCEELGLPLRGLRIDHDAAGLEDALRIFGMSLISIVLSEETLTFHRLMVAEGGRIPELTRRMWQAGHDNAGQMLREWIDGQQRAGKLRCGVDPYRLARQFISMVIADAQLAALAGVETLEAAGRRACVEHAVVTFLSGQEVRS